MTFMWVFLKLVNCLLVWVGCRDRQHNFNILILVRDGNLEVFIFLAVILQDIQLWGQTYNYVLIGGVDPLWQPTVWLQLFIR